MRSAEDDVIPDIPYMVDLFFRLFTADMKIKKLGTNELILEVKSISWLGTFGTLLIWAGLFYGLIFQSIILSGKFDLFGLIFFLVLSLFCLLGLAVSLSIEIWHFKGLEGQFVYLNRLLFFSQKMTKYSIQEIQKVELEKIVPAHDDVGGVQWCIFCYLMSGKRVEIYCYAKEEDARKIAQTIQEYLN